MEYSFSTPFIDRTAKIVESTMSAICKTCIKYQTNIPTEDQEKAAKKLELMVLNKMRGLSYTCHINGSAKVYEAMRTIDEKGYTWQVNENCFTDDIFEVSQHLELKGTWLFVWLYDYQDETLERVADYKAAYTQEKDVEKEPQIVFAYGIKF